MPYIKSGDGRREALQRGEPAQTAGELNYQIFYYVKHNCKCMVTESQDLATIMLFVTLFLGLKPNYQRWNDMTGALVRCEKEIKRRLDIDGKILIEIMNYYDFQINRYEDLKLAENGDVE